MICKYRKIKNNGKVSAVFFQINNKNLSISSLVFNLFSKQGCRGTSHDAHTYRFADVMFAFVKHHHLVLLCSATELSLIHI